MAEEDKVEQPIIVKKIKKGGGHHGGAWKVAYADFVTAMMAFFLLLWLLNVSTDEELNAISSFFDPTHPSVSDRTSGAGGVLGGLSMAEQGSMATNLQPITDPAASGSAVNNRSAKKDDIVEEVDSKREAAKERQRKQEEARFKKAEEALKEAIENNPELADMKEHLIVDMTPEGLRIQVIDKEGKPMFASGSAQMFQKTQTLLEKVGEIISELPNELSIRGHTDSVPYGPGATYTNWELSSDRANSSRRVLLDSGFAADRINNVVGKADTEHLIPDDPNNASNRRISITLLKEELTNPNFGQIGPSDDTMIGDDPIQEEPEELEETEESLEDSINPDPIMPKIGTFKRTPGAVEFP